MRSYLAGISAFVMAAALTACGSTGSTTTSPQTRSACAEVLSVTSATLPTAHPTSVVLWPPLFINKLAHSGSPLLTRVASELSTDAMANKATQETAAMDSATAYCRALGSP